MEEIDNEEELFTYAERPNKTAIKREFLQLEVLGEELTALSHERLLALDLPEKLLNAVQEAKNISHGGAKKRQRKFIAKLLRSTDIEPIQTTLADYKQQSALAIHDQHVLERWRDRLIAGEADAMNELLETWPQTDRQKIRQLVRDAQKERMLAVPPKFSRLLFRYLRETVLKSENGM